MKPLEMWRRTYMNEQVNIDRRLYSNTVNELKITNGRRKGILVSMMEFEIGVRWFLILPLMALTALMWKMATRVQKT
jgi:hypothetical protein